MRPATRRWWLGLALLGLAGCDGEIIAETAAVPGASAPPAPLPFVGATAADPQAQALPVAPPCVVRRAPDQWATFRQLTRRELSATADAVAGTSLQLEAQLPQDGQTRLETGVASNIGTLMSDQGLASLTAAARKVSAAVLADLSARGHCAVKSRATPGCLESFVAQLGAQAYRRPLTSGETAALLTLERGEADPSEAVRLVVEALVLSPQFVFHVELGSGPVVQGRVALTPYELAARLAYFVTGRPPTEALRAAAARGELSSPDGVRTWARALYGSPEGRAKQVGTVMEWLQVDALDGVAKSPALFPEFTPALKAQLQADAEQTLAARLIDEGTSFSSWLTQERGPGLPALAALYGTDATRRGPLMSPAWLARHSTGQGTSPTRRGKFITERLLCTPVPPPPPNVAIPPLPADDGHRTTRQRVEAHDTMPCARACHSLMDPVGFSLEGFDPIGRRRALDNGQPVDTTGAVKIRDVVGQFQGPDELATLIAGSSAFEECVTQQWLERAQGVPPRLEDRCEVERIAADLRASAGGVQSLVEAIVTAPLFRAKGVCTP
ncbi:MAG: DUF1588 domain-containing protein [Myxococcaceae bacterium]|nr:DUF1588 domain-containing protein [Myxococcaceae bacterium]